MDQSALSSDSLKLCKSCWERPQAGRLRRRVCVQGFLENFASTAGLAKPAWDKGHDSPLLGLTSWRFSDLVEAAHFPCMFEVTPEILQGRSPSLLPKGQPLCTAPRPAHLQAGPRSTTVLPSQFIPSPLLLPSPYFLLCYKGSEVIVLALAWFRSCLRLTRSVLPAPPPQLSLWGSLTFLVCVYGYLKKDHGKVHIT